MSITVWYCQLCSGVVKTKPVGVIPRSCACDTPLLPLRPTKVTW